VCGPLRPIEDDAGPGEVELEKPGNPPGCAALLWQGGEKVADFPNSLSHI
jgi:hypothetical protein